MTFPAFRRLSRRLPAIPATPAIIALAAAALALPVAPSAQADDRDVLQEAAARPYLFFLLDNSGSMNLRPPCDQDDIDDGKCEQADFCEDDDGCRVPLEGDDPRSKFRIAREALYEVLETVDDIDFGFATMDQNALHVKNKHWLYQVDATQPAGFFSLSGGVTFPTAGSYETFGATLTCTGGTDDQNVACMPLPGGCGNGQAVRCAPADTNDSWEIERFRRLPRLGTDGETDTVLYLRVPDNTRYRVTYDAPGSPPAPVTYGDTGSITVEVEIVPCSNDDCTSVVAASRITKELTYSAVGSYLIHDPTIDRTGSATEVGWLGYRDAEATSDCDWEGNLDASSDAYSGYSLTWPHLDSADPLDPRVDPDRYISCYPEGESEPTADDVFPVGDALPFDWKDSNLNEILDHLASQVGDLNPDDDFGVASYFNDTRQSGDAFLRLRSEDDRVMIPVGSPSLGHTIKGFRGWYGGCRNDTPSCAQVGFSDVGAVCDPDWGCRQVFLVILTDGDIQDDVGGGNQNACPNGENAPNSCSETAGMRAQYGIETYVLAFGRENNSQNVLNCLAANSHTQDPIYPKNKQDLVDILNEIIGRVREEASSFASAAVPQVQANATDKIYLSSFTPLNDSGYWAGRLDAFLKPLPLLPGGEPDRSTVCSSSVQSQCFLWDAGDVQAGHPGDADYQPGRLLLQAPDATELLLTPPWDPDDLMLGAGANERRVIYTQFSQAGNRRLFTYPETADERFDLWSEFGISFAAADLTAADDGTNAVINDANRAIAKTLVEKEAVVETTDPTDPDLTISTPITFLMGDIFHADPIVLSRPNNFLYYTNDPYLNQPLCGAAANEARTPPPSYRWFADRHFCRRSLLMVAANDGQLHVFDGGTFGQVGSTPAECLLPAKDLDGDGTAEENEFNLSGLGDDDYDLGDEISGFKSCDSDSDCGGVGSCTGGFCTNVKIGVVDGAYSNGTGREIFSFIPRALLRRVYEMTQDDANRRTDAWGMDGSPRIDDVFIDPLATENSVTCLNREWRTVAIGGYREGGSGYYALDITQPDTLDNDHVPQPSGTPAYVPSCFEGLGACTRPYPSVLWEFEDTESVSTGSGTDSVQLDEDLNNLPDFANSWSRASTGRIRVCTGGCTAAETEDRFVAVFGGGLGDEPTDAHGNFIYMVDIETGKTLYKKRVVGAVPGDVATIDYNGDGLIDRLYAGTTEGFVYKVQLETNSANAMKITTQTITTRVAGTDVTLSVQRLEGPTGDEAKYDPFQVFSTGGRPIYHEISAVFVAERNRLAMAFGTGNRSDLWEASGQEGRFYVILDDNFVDANHDGVLDNTCTGCAHPRTEASYHGLDPLDPFINQAQVNYLYIGGGGNTQPGWYFTLDEDEKVITEGFSLGGVTIFTSFVPTTAVVEDSDGDPLCTKAGTSRIFIVGTVTAVGYAVPPGGTISDRARYSEIDQFTTPPFVERSATANPESGGGTEHADYITESLAVIRDELKKLQSSRCRYAGYTQNIKTIRSDTGVVFVAPIPLCIDPTSWKEF